MSLTDRSTDMTTATTGTSRGRGYSVGAIVCAVIALFLVPPLFGLIGAVLGFIGYRKGDKLGLYAAIGSLVAMFVGLALAAALFAAGDAAA